jgi:hypothetical protein
MKKHTSDDNEIEFLDRNILEMLIEGTVHPKDRSKDNENRQLHDAGLTLLSKTTGYLEA